MVLSRIAFLKLGPKRMVSLRGIKTQQRPDAAGRVEVSEEDGFPKRD